MLRECAGGHCARAPPSSLLAHPHLLAVPPLAQINFFPAIGIISFAFVCHHACFMVYNTLRDNTEARWNRTVHTSIGVALSIMLVLAASA